MWPPQPTQQGSHKQWTLLDQHICTPLMPSLTCQQTLTCFLALDLKLYAGFPHWLSPCKLPTHKINGEASRKSEIAPTPTASASPMVILCICLSKYFWRWPNRAQLFSVKSQYSGHRNIYKSQIATKPVIYIPVMVNSAWWHIVQCFQEPREECTTV